MQTCSFLMDLPSLEAANVSGVGSGMLGKHLRRTAHVEPETITKSKRLNQIHSRDSALYPYGFNSTGY